MIRYGCTSLLRDRFPKLPSPFRQHCLGNLGNLGSNKELQPILHDEMIWTSHWRPSVSGGVEHNGIDANTTTTNHYRKYSLKNLCWVQNTKNFWLLLTEYIMLEKSMRVQYECIWLIQICLNQCHKLSVTVELIFLVQVRCRTEIGLLHLT